MNESDVQPPGTNRFRGLRGPLSRTGPEVPPDIADRPVSAPPVVDEPTELLPILPQPVPVAPKIAARAVIVYEPQPRRSWGLWAFTAMLVALTVGVVLGQTSAYQPTRSRAAAQTVPLPSETVPAPAPQQLTAPLGTDRTRRLELTGASPLVQIRSADLGDLLYRLTTTGPAGSAPASEDTPRGPRLTVAGPDPVEVLLNSAVRWTVRLTGTAAEQRIDMRGGGLAGVELAGSAAHVALDLPDPKGTVPVRLTGTVRDLRIRAGTDVPVRLRLGKGADTATLDGTEHRAVQSGTALTPPGWKSAKNRYDVKASTTVTSVLVERPR